MSSPAHSLLRRVARRIPVVGSRLAAADARRRFLDEAAAALDSVAGSAAPPLLLGYFPRFRTNPFQRMLYLAAADHGIAVAGMSQQATIHALADLQRAGTRTLLHLHWLTPVLEAAHDEADGAARIDAFTDRLDRYRAAGGRIAWTVHNVLPHEARWQALEIRLCRAVVERADLVHVMAADTAARVAPYYPLPADRIVHVPLPSYAGVYPTTLTRAAARHHFGIDDDTLVFVAFGAIRAYKGLDVLLAAWRTLPADRPRRLLVAGAPLDDPGEVAPVIEALRREPGVTVDARKIPDDELPRYLLAADVAVMPYVRILNSAALLLYLTFGLPVLVPAGGSLAELVDPAFALTFEGGNPASLADALERADELSTPEARAAAAAAAAQYDPVVLSGRLMAELRHRLAASDAGAGYR